MRTLLVDNYDSFTYNLFHYLAEVNGHPPTVITNDAADWRPGDIAGYHNVVISPGPGTPERDRDLGICRDILRRADLPVLGVCLGHQAIAYDAGAAVVRAPEPWHGRRSSVIHTGTGLFEGLPSPFSAVRYHSLMVTELPSELEATAWTPDGLLMALRHRHRPLWGVQFHPESIQTEHGRRLLANFAGLTRSHGRQSTQAGGAPPHRPPSPETGPRAAGPQTTGSPAGGSAASRGRPGRALRVLVERIPTGWHDEVVFDRLFRGRPYAYWLDSSGAAAGMGRFSVMGDATGPLARVVSADVWHGTVTVHGDGWRETGTGAFFDWLRRDLADLRVTVPELPCDFALGWVGYLGYELKAECGGRRAHRSPVPDATMVFADRAVVFDHATGTTLLLALAPEDDHAAAREWLRETAGRLRATAGLAPPSVVSPGVVSPGGVRSLRWRHDRRRYLDLIAACQAEIAAGETYEVCLTNMIESPGPVDVWSCYRSLRRANPVPFGALLQFDEVAVLSTSPERFLRVTGDGLVESRPIKGTRPRGASPEADKLLREDLAGSEKDRAENLMIVDLVRNDLGRVAEVGSVHVPALFGVETFATVHQMVSTVRASLRADTNTVDCVRAAFPGGSMTGAPKIRTMQIIDGLEAGPRGVYSGAIGYLSVTGAADLSIAIRTVVATPEGLSYGTGGAIVALSDPGAEFDETVVKAAPLRNLVDGGPDHPVPDPDLGW